MRMTPSSFLSIYEKLEKLVHRLPEALQQPILREITPIKTLFLLQRAPRLVLLGQSDAGKAELLNAIFAGEIVRPEHETVNDGMWQSFQRTGSGSLRLLDAREPASLHVIKAALAAEQPDVLIFVQRAGAANKASAAEIDRACEVASLVSRADPERGRLVPLLLPSGRASIEKARNELNAAIHSRRELSERATATTILGEDLVAKIAIELPGDAQLEMARLSGDRELQRQIAKVLMKSVSAICAAVGAQPIPLADFPILTTLQTMMVAGIMHISGREMSLKLGGEFMASIGANLGIGLVLREGARAAVKLIPVWGSAVSGGVAAAGTYAMGRAAVAYYIDGVSLKDTRSFLRRKRAEPELLRDADPSLKKKR